MKIRNAVVPVAGLGTRLLPATKSQPKEMLPVGRKPIVQYVLEELQNAGMQRLLFVTGRGKSSIEDHFDEDQSLIRTLRESGKEDLLATLDFERNSPQVLYVRQKQQNGLGDAISYAENFTSKEPFLVALGDSIIGRYQQSASIRQLIDVFEEQQPDVAILVENVSRDQVHHYGIVKACSDSEVFEIAKLVEKPKPQEAPSTLAIAGRYVFSPKIFEALKHTKPSKNGEIQLTDAITHLLETGARVVGVKLPQNERRYDIGNYRSYFETFLEFALSDPEYGKELQAKLPHILSRIK